MDRAVCARLTGWDEASEVEQREVCAGCPVRVDCAAYGLQGESLASGNEKGWPVFGGLDRAARLRLRTRGGLYRVEGDRIKAAAATVSS